MKSDEGVTRSLIELNVPGAQRGKVTIAKKSGAREGPGNFERTLNVIAQSLIERSLLNVQGDVVKNE